MIYSILDRLFLGFERRNVQLNQALAQIPYLSGRKGGTHSISDWAYTIGMFHAVLSYTLGTREKVDHLDVGCGTGRLALASKLLLGPRGSYTGIDVNEHDIAFCRKHYDDPRCSFVHLSYKNRAYAAGQSESFVPYPFKENCFDVVTALSVWTHLNERDAIFYLGEVARVLKPDGKAVITFFLLDNEYEDFLKRNPAEASEFTFRRAPSQYKFDKSVDGSDAWFYPAWARVPEAAIGVAPIGMQRLVDASGLRIVDTRHGYWREKPGLFFQDVVVLAKPSV